MSRYTAQGLTCEERDGLLKPQDGYPGWSVHASLTDISGQFGEPKIITSWINDTTRQVVEDIRRPDPDGGQDLTPCKHFDHGVLLHDDDYEEEQEEDESSPWLTA